MSSRFLVILAAVFLCVGCTDNSEKNQAPRTLFDYDNFSSGVGTEGADAENATGSWSSSFYVVDDGRSANSDDEGFEEGIIAASAFTTLNSVTAGGALGLTVEVEITEVDAAEEGVSVEDEAQLKLYRVDVSIDFTAADNGASTANYAELELTVLVSDGQHTIQWSGIIDVSRAETA